MRVALFNPEHERKVDWGQEAFRLGNVGNLVYLNALSPYCLNFNPRFVTDDEIAVINNTCSCVLLPMANTLNRTQEYSEFFFTLLKKFSIPLYLFSVGIQLSLGEDITSLVLSRDVNRLLTLVADPIFVRGNTSQAFVETVLGRRARVIGCPSFLSLKQVQAQAVDATKPCAFQCTFTHADEVRIYEWGCRNRATYIAQSEPFFGCNHKDHPWISCPYRPQMIQSLPSKVFFPSDVNNWLTMLQEHSMLITTRIHGAIMALKASIPVILVIIDQRTQELAEIHGVPHVHVSKVENDFFTRVCDLYREKIGLFNANLEHAQELVKKVLHDLERARS